MRVLVTGSSGYLGSRPLNFVDVILKVNRALVLWARAAVARVGKAGKVGQLLHGTIDLKGAAAVVCVLNVLPKCGRQGFVCDDGGW